ncbi:Glyoxylase, beta-lactamase superfamily II [Marinitoga hydrogenitolerans DSM 16785]|uniref:Glyoxylase, beta-lactamase superfamily II n=1 Tax=Marinitoga hydrogenitolerans (strain DSM 16785 / JCM 12826 / AT1271) TaxID=1122195 RepID=A0A1M4XEW0_MARH1|nr:MBL fold metallo-hydrolase [Marinitoga hydrogenitolerans]SHE92035.1 Glyoxylase, beta-lactamase superfamily II [Marinitoga hydrogenitolerans DSM 16785]
MLEVIENKVLVFWFENFASNVTAVELNEEVILIDSSLYPEKFKKVIDLVQLRTKKTVKKVFLTHHHPDHSFGAIFHGEIEIILSEKTLVKLFEYDDILLKKISDESGFEFSNIQKKLAKCKFNVFRNDNLNTSSKTIISGISLGGHTEDSTIYKIYPENILVSGDIIVSGVHSELNEANIDNWIKILEELKKQDIKTIIPGHGKPGNIKLIDNQLKYLKTFKEKGKDLLLKNFDTYKYPELLLNF